MRPSWPDSTDALSSFVALVVSGLVVFGAWWQARRERPAIEPPSEQDAERDWAISSLLVSVAFLLALVSSFRFAFDDFEILAAARRGAFASNGGLRYLSNGLRIMLAETLGGKRAYAAFNLLAVIGIAWAWRSFLGACGWSKGRATIAASTALVVAPGLPYVARIVAGFEQVASMALVFAALAMFEHAAREPEDRPRRALAFELSGAWFVAVGVFVKFPTDLVAPLAVACSVAFGGHSRGWNHRLRLVAIPFLTWALCMYVWRSDLSTELNKAHAANPAAILRQIGSNLIDLAVLQKFECVALAGVLAWSFVGRSRSKVFASGLVAPRRERLRLVGLAFAFVAPFLANTTYFTAYYLLMASFPASTLLVELAAACLPSEARGRIAAVVLAGALVPSFQHLLGSERPYDPDVEPLLRAVASAAKGAVEVPPSHARFTWRVACPEGADPMRRSAPHLFEVATRCSGSAGLRWATGWNGVSVAYEGLERELPSSYDGPALDGPPDHRFEVAFCEGHPPVVTKVP